MASAVLLIMENVKSLTGKTLVFLLRLASERLRSYLWVNIGQTIIEQFAISPSKLAVFQKHAKYKRN